MNVITLTKPLEGKVAVTDVFQSLQNLFNSPVALLETASISTKEHTRSVIMLSAALKISCLGENVTLVALNANGQQALPLIAEQFKRVNQNDNQLVITVSHLPLKQQVDEREKLVEPSVFDVLRSVLSLYRCQHTDDQTTQLIGTFSFDCYQLFESIPNVEQSQPFPDYEFFLADNLIVVDHENLSQRVIVKALPGNNQSSIVNDYQGRISKIETILNEGVSRNSLNTSNEKSVDLSDIEVNVNDRQFTEYVELAKEHIKAGDVFQMVLARDFRLPCLNAFSSYLALRESNPSPYMFYLKSSDYELFGASPESAVKFDASDRRLSIYPIAGTRKRGLNKDLSINHDLDARIELELKNDEKEKAEHLMLVDLARNDIARVCDSGTRKIDRLLEIDRYSHVMHLVSKVSGRLGDEFDALSAYQACMNMGTLSGAPKVRATQLIRSIEKKYRGVYGGAMGYINAAGDMDTAIVIRSALVKDKVAVISAGAGIVFDSQPVSEIKETENKAAAVIRAVQLANKSMSADSEEALHG